MLKTLRSAGDRPLRFTSYPTGEFSASLVREIPTLTPDMPSETYEEAKRYTDASYAKNQVSDKLRDDLVRSTLGSSNVLNSHKPRKARGRKGMSRYNKRLIVNSCVLLEKNYGKKHLSFLTLTLPPECENGTANLYAEAKRQLGQWLQRRLGKVGLPSYVIGCTEIQMGRYGKSGAVALHEHWVFVGRRPGASWCIRPNEIQQAWLSILESCYKVAIAETHRHSAVRIESIKRSVGAYLGKYMSKSDAVVDGIIADGREECLPSSWVTRSMSMLKMFNLSIVRFNIEDSISISHAIMDNASIFCRWSRHLWIEVESGFNVWLGFVGYFNSEGFKLLKTFNT